MVLAGTLFRPTARSISGSGSVSFLRQDRVWLRARFCWILSGIVLPFITPPFTSVVELDTLDRLQCPDLLPCFLCASSDTPPRLESEFDLTCAFGGGGTGVLFLQSLTSNGKDPEGSLADGLCFRGFLVSGRDGPLVSGGRGGRSLYRSILMLGVFHPLYGVTLCSVDLYSSGKALCTSKNEHRQMHCICML